MRNSTRTLCTTVACLTIGFGSYATLVHADGMGDMKDKMGDMKDKMGDADSSKMKDEMKEQEEAQKSLESNWNDATFVTVASMANNDEIKAAEMAEEKSSNADVKDFAKMMVEDHTKAGEEMTDLAKKKGWHVSEKCDVKHMMKAHEMKSMTGADYDKAYVEAQVKDHEDAIALFKMASEKASDSDLKAWTAKEVPTFESHLKAAEKLRDKLMSTAS